MPTITVEEIRSRVESFLQAYNEHDVDAILSRCTEDVVWEDPSLTEPLVGREMVAVLLRSQFAAFPDLHFPKEEIEIYRSLGGKRAAARWHLVTTMTGRLEPPGLEPTGRTAQITGMCVYEFHDGLIARHTMIYDVLSFTQQLGIMPDPGSLQFKALMGLQNAQNLGRKFVQGLWR